MIVTGTFKASNAITESDFEIPNLVLSIHTREAAKPATKMLARTGATDSDRGRGLAEPAPDS